MDPIAGPLDVESLARHGEFLRRLARTLVSEADADDAVQDSWLAAMRADAPAVRDSGAWLRGVVSRIALRMRRTEARRVARESAAARREALPSTADLVARESARRQLVEAVLELPETYRVVVLLRYIEDLSAADIARRLRVPDATIRTRLRRGLDLLRSRLDANYGGRDAWTAILAPLGGAIAMHKGSALAVGILGILLLLAGAGWWAFGGGGERIEKLGSGGRGEVARIPTKGAGGAQVPAATTTRPGSREAVAASAPAASKPATTATLLVKVFAFDGTPCPGVGIAVDTVFGGAGWGGNESLRSPRARTGPDGIARFVGIEPGTLRLRTDRRLDESKHSSPQFYLAAGASLTVAAYLEKGIDADVEVVDSQGTPVAGATVWAQGLTGFDLGTTGPDGKLALRALNRWTGLTASAPGHAPSEPFSLLTLPGPAEKIRIPLGGAGAAVRGTVVNADGQPVEGAAVWLGPESFSVVRETQPNGITKTRFRYPQRVVWTDADGRFAADGLRPDSLPVFARAAHLAPWSGSLALAPGETAELEIHLQPGARILGKVATASGEPAAGGAEIYFGGALASVTGTHIRALRDGSFDIDGLPTGAIDIVARGEVIRADPGGARESEYGEARARFDLVPNQIVRWDPVLSKGNRITGVVVDSQGKALARYMVRVLVRAPDTASYDFLHGVRIANADADGRFEVDCLPPGRHTVEVKFPLGRDTTIPLVTLYDVEAPALDLRLVVPKDRIESHGKIVGKVVGADGAPVLGAHVSYNSPGLPLGTIPAVTDEKGDFQIPSLPAGRYDLSASGGGNKPSASATIVVELAESDTKNIGSLVLGETAVSILTILREDGLTEPIPTNHFQFLDGERVHDGRADVKLPVGKPFESHEAPGPHAIRVRSREFALANYPYVADPRTPAKVNVWLRKGQQVPIKWIGPIGQRIRGVHADITPDGGTTISGLLLDYDPILCLAPGGYRIDLMTDDGLCGLIHIDVVAGPAIPPVEIPIR